MSRSIIPLLSVRRGAKAVEFYKDAFGATEKLVLEDDGSIFAMLMIAEVEFWVSDESLEFDNFSPETLGGATTRIVLVVDDPRAVFDQAVKAGATPKVTVSEVHGWLTGRVRDPFGHHWEIGREL